MLIIEKGGANDFQEAQEALYGTDKPIINPSLTGLLKPMIDYQFHH